MPDSTKLLGLRQRAERAQAAVESFARIEEEFKTILKALPEGPQQERVKKLLSLNAETLTAVKRSLVIAENNVTRERKSAKP